MKRNYCESCNTLTDERVCLRCGKKRTRPVREEDFCFYVNLRADNVRLFEAELKKEARPLVALPEYAGGATSYETGNKAYFRIFLRYGDFQKATEIFRKLFEK